MEEEFPSYYSLADEIGRGAFCVNRRCIDLRNQHEYLAKIVNLKKIVSLAGLNKEDVQREVRLCKKLNHPHIVEVYDAYYIKNDVYIISEMTSGLDLCYEIVNKVNTGFVYSESVASHYIRQVLEGLSYIHENNIVHRDIKPHNVMLGSHDDAAPVKIGEFGIALEMPEEGYITSGRIGTPHFMAPEVVNREPYGFPVDMWGCGVMMYILLGGTFPFHGIGDEIFTSVSTGKYAMLSKVWDCISDQAKNIVQQMLEFNKDGRITSHEALEHPWLKERDVYAKRAHLQESVNELKKFNARRKLKGAILATMASRKLTGALSRATNVLQVNATASYRAVGVNNNKENEILGAGVVTQLIDSLDDFQTLIGARNEDISFLHCLFENRKLQAKLEIHSLSQKVTKHLDIATAKANAVECLYEVEVLLKSLNNLDASSKRLSELLEDPHVKAIIKTYDDVIKELQGKNVLFSKNTASIPFGVADNLTRVRLVQFSKNSNEAMGITLRMNEDKHCVVARIIHGGMIHRQGTLHVGDEIREINGVNVSAQSVEKLQQFLRDASGDVTFKIVPSLRNDELDRKDLYVRCLFDYDPRADDLIPCQQAGMAFKCRDILEVVSKVDCHWWQAVKEGEKKVAGLIPAPELQERRIANLALEKGKTKENGTCIWPRKKKLKQRASRYSARFNTVFDKLDLVTYEEVAFTRTFQRRTLVLIGAHGVGRRHIKNSLMPRFPEKYACPIPHTSRRPEPHERDGESWHFVSKEHMLSNIAKNRFLEYGHNEGSLYGTKLDVVRDIIKNGKIPILDVETPTLKILRCKEFSPYIVFISSPPSFPLSGDVNLDDSLQRLISESEDLKNLYKHVFDYTIVNNAIEDTVEDLVNHLQQLDHSSDWLPVSWLY